MRRLIFLFLFELFIIHVTAQSFLLKGEVVDFRTEEKMANATVKNGHTNQIVTANQKGMFELMVAVNDSIIVSAIGYQSDTIPITMNTHDLLIQLLPLTKSLNEVVISGTLKEIQKSNSPIAVESYSARFFKKNVTATVFEALSIVNGVQPQLNCNVCNTGDIHINGMEGPYTMVLIDGMPVVSNLATVYGFSGIPASLIKRIEIVKGPSSTLYGSEAVAGLINIITKDAATAAPFHVDLQGTTYQEWNLDLSAKQKIGKAYSLIGLNLFHFDRRFDLNRDHFTDITLQKRVSLFNKWSFERKHQLPFQIAIRLLAEDRWGGEMNWNQSWKGSDSVYGESILTKRLELMGNYGLQLGKEQLLIEYAYNFHQQDSYYGKLPFFAKQHALFSQLRWNKEKGRHALLAGLPFRFTWLDDNTAITASSDGLQSKPLINQMVGLFLQDEFKWNPQWTVLGGIRFEQTNLHGAIFSPRVAVKWQTLHQQIIRLSAGNGFRVVNLFTEDHAALSGAREVVISEKLNPEKSWNANLNYTSTFTPGFGYVTIDASLFYTYFTNKIIPDYQTDPQKIIYSNIDGYAVSRGLTINSDFNFKKHFKIIAGITWMDVFTKEKNLTGFMQKKQQLFAPRFSGNYALTYNWVQQKLTIDFTGKLYGPQRLPVVPNDFRPANSPWFSLANLQVAKRFAHSFEIYAGVKNLFNFMPKHPILRPEDPFDKRVNDPVNNPYNYSFDPSYNYAPIMQRRLMIGIRYTVE